MPDLSFDTALRIFALLASIGLLMWLAHHLDCRESRRTKEAQRLADIERATENARRIAHAQQVLAGRITPRAGETFEAYSLRRRKVMDSISKRTTSPYVIPPASMSEPPHMHSINTSDSDDLAAAVITTLCMPADVADTHHHREH
jgi:hypothetical protein